MAEKTAFPQQGQRAPKSIEDVTVYETPEYRVFIAQMSSGPEGTPVELLTRYVIQHKTHGVIYGTANGLGVAIASALTAQAESLNAADIAESQKARGYRAGDLEPTQQKGAGVQFPKFH